MLGKQYQIASMICSHYVADAVRSSVTVSSSPTIKMLLFSILHLFFEFSFSFTYLFLSVYSESIKKSFLLLQYTSKAKLNTIKGFYSTISLFTI